MIERPLLFSAPMIQAVEADRKTQTRRVAKPRRVASILGDAMGSGPWDDSYILDPHNREWLMRDAPCQPGDVLWVRENFRLKQCHDGLSPTDAAISSTPNVKWEADGKTLRPEDGVGGGWSDKLHPSIHLPRWATRRLLNCIDVRLERLNDCGEADAAAEGLERDAVGWGISGTSGIWVPDPVAAYHLLWDHINGPGAWAKNPLVWVIVFEKVRP